MNLFKTFDDQPLGRSSLPFFFFCFVYPISVNDMVVTRIETESKCYFELTQHAYNR